MITENINTYYTLQPGLILAPPPKEPKVDVTHCFALFAAVMCHRSFTATAKVAASTCVEFALVGFSFCCTGQNIHCASHSDSSRLEPGLHRFLTIIFISLLAISHHQFVNPTR